MDPETKAKYDENDATLSAVSKLLVKSDVKEPGSSKVALITGITGQVAAVIDLVPRQSPQQDGSYLAEFLLSKGYTVSLRICAMPRT